MAYGVILKHLEVDKITWGHFQKFPKESAPRPPLRGALMAFTVRKRGRVPFFNWCGEHCINNEMVQGPCAHLGLYDILYFDC
jgi:hypothetical protein